MLLYNYQPGGGGSASTSRVSTQVKCVLEYVPAIHTTPCPLKNNYICWDDDISVDCRSPTPTPTTPQAAVPSPRPPHAPSLCLIVQLTLISSGGFRFSCFAFAYFAYFAFAYFAYFAT